ncbi:TonB-dependent receptor [Pseudoflavitalea rhizosphaerae]|uniref:TonB-dependent receptor n=1 Tax=Pseudoflavitalea rhizosphaerae TaxID=1884793 RepID=UPI000F8D47D3|nr:TonB-dependent receptor [Pseudoflavitalea rhizosphaerae]
MFKTIKSSLERGKRGLFAPGRFIKTCFLSTIYLLILSQAGAQAPAKKISISFSNTALKEVLVAIEKQSGYRINYSIPDVNDATKINVNIKDAGIRETLKATLRNTSYQYIIDGTIVIIKPQPKPAATAVPVPAPGLVSGKVIDQESGEPIADVSISFGKKGTTTAIDGSFTISLSKGRYEAEISAIGYGKKEITDIEVKENQNFNLNITLKKEKGSLETVVVKASARRESVAALYARQKNFASISDGISAEQIQRTPDKNLGETLKRISGLATMENKYVVIRGMSERYNQAMLNGQIMPSTELNRKNFSYDMIPTNVVDNIAVIKSITPDQSAEFGGGLVQVNIKDIPSQAFTSISVGGSYNDRTTGKSFHTLKLEGKEYFAAMSDHRKLFGRSDWNNVKEVADYFDNKGKSPASFGNNWAVHQMNAQPSQNYSVSTGRSYMLGNEKKFGFVAAISYRNTQQTQDVVSGRNGFDGNMINGNLDSAGLLGKQYGFITNIGALAGAGFSGKKIKLSWQNFYSRVLDQQLLTGTGKHADNARNALSMGFFENMQHSSLFQSQLRGEHAIGSKGIKINWMGSYIDLDRQRPDNHALWGEIQQTSGKRSELQIYNIIDAKGPTTSSAGDGVTGVLRSWSRVKEKNYAWDASVQVPFTWKQTKNIFKAGTAGWYKERNFYVIRSGHGASDAGVYPFIGNLFTPEFDHKANIASYGDEFRKKVPLYAGYGMFDNRIGSKLRLVWGLRAEFFDMDKVNDQIREIARQYPDKDASSLHNREKNWQFFPSANLTYSLTPQMNLRLAFSKSIIRPDLRDLSFFEEYDFELGGMYIGGLVRSTILHNYDFRYEWYPGPGEVISASLFYKNFKYPMEIYQQAGNRVFELKNNYDSRNYGIELEVRKTLAFTDLPVIRNITLYGNFTYMNARVRQMVETASLNPAGDTIIIKREVKPEEKRPLSGQSNYTYNAGIFYDHKFMGLSLTYNRTTNRVFRPAVAYFDSYFERPIEALDFQVSGYFLQKKLEVRLSVSNLLDSYNVVYQKVLTAEEAEKAIKNELPDKNYLFDKNGNDIINLLNKPGRTYSISLNYSF